MLFGLEISTFDALLATAFIAYAAGGFTVVLTMLWLRNLESQDEASIGSI